MVVLSINNFKIAFLSLIKYLRALECSTHRSQKRMLDLLELELQEVEDRFLCVLGTETGSPTRAASTLPY